MREVVVSGANGEFDSERSGRLKVYEDTELEASFVDASCTA